MGVKEKKELRARNLIRKMEEVKLYCIEDNSKYLYEPGWGNGLEVVNAKLNLASLWHDASEEPRHEEFLLAEEYNEFNVYKLSGQEDNDSWELLVSAMGIIRWAYISDLVPKSPKGGEK